MKMGRQLLENTLFVTFLLFIFTSICFSEEKKVSFENSEVCDFSIKMGEKDVANLKVDFKKKTISVSGNKELVNYYYRSLLGTEIKVSDKFLKELNKKVRDLKNDEKPENVENIRKNSEIINYSMKCVDNKKDQKTFHSYESEITTGFQELMYGLQKKVISTVKIKEKLDYKFPEILKRIKMISPLDDSVLESYTYLGHYHNYKLFFVSILSTRTGKMIIFRDNFSYGWEWGVREFSAPISDDEFRKIAAHYQKFIGKENQAGYFNNSLVNRELSIYSVRKKNGKSTVVASNCIFQNKRVFDGPSCKKYDYKLKTDYFFHVIKSELKGIIRNRKKSGKPIRTYKPCETDGTCEEEKKLHKNK